MTATGSIQQNPPQNLRNLPPLISHHPLKHPIIQTKKTSPTTNIPKTSHHLPPLQGFQMFPLTFCDLHKPNQIPIKPAAFLQIECHKIIIKKFIKSFIVPKPYSNNLWAAHLIDTMQPYHTFQDLQSILAMLNVTRRLTDDKKIQTGMRMKTKNHDGNGYKLKERNQLESHGIPVKDPMTLAN